MFFVFPNALLIMYGQPQYVHTDKLACSAKNCIVLLKPSQ